MAISCNLGFLRYRKVLFLSAIAIVALLLWHFRTTIYLGWTLVSLPMYWWKGSSAFLISEETDNFDLTFANYSQFQTTAGDGYEDHIPPVMHHIMLGSNPHKDPSWNDCRQTCMDLHPGWESILWTDELADKLIAEKFPDFRETWDSYPFPIERVDALRYLALYEYGGIVLDMDLQCRRSVGPLRRFKFVAPAAHPTGFSISFIMTSKHNPFIKTVIEQLKVYNRNWFNLPYVTVMFSTGGHFSSAVHVQQPDRSEMKILAGPKDNFTLNTINGPVVTPLFEHLGSSSWHSFDAIFIASLGKYMKYIVFLFVVGLVAGVFCVSRLRKWRLRLLAADQEKRIA